MNNLFYTQQQWEVFARCLHGVFVKTGFEVLEEPYIDYSLYGFRATYIRRYFLQKPTIYHDGILTSIVHVVGLPFGCQSKKMVILSAPRDIENEPISETVKLRIHFDHNGFPYVFHGEHQPTKSKPTTSEAVNINDDPFGTMFGCGNQSNQSKASSSLSSSSSSLLSQTSEEKLAARTYEQFTHDLASYVSHIIEIISPGLIQLPTEMKLEILKKLSVDSIIRMSRVNSEFRAIIFQHGESLWRHLCYRDFHIKFINRMMHSSWMELYRDSYILHQAEVCRKERALPGLPERPALPPVPYRLQIEWLPEVLQLPFYPRGEIMARPMAEDPLQLALEFPLRRADSLDSIH